MKNHCGSFVPLITVISSFFLFYFNEKEGNKRDETGLKWIFALINSKTNQDRDEEDQLNEWRDCGRSPPVNIRYSWNILRRNRKTA